MVSVGSISKADVSLSHKSTTILGQIPAPAWARFMLLARSVSVPGQVPLAGTPLLRACLGVGAGAPFSPPAALDASFFY